MAQVGWYVIGIAGIELKLRLKATLSFIPVESARLGIVDKSACFSCLTFSLIADPMTARQSLPECRLWSLCRK